MELRLRLFFCLCILILKFGNSSGQTESNEDDETVYTTTIAGNENSTTISDVSVNSMTTESVTNTTGSSKSRSVASTEKKQMSAEKGVSHPTPTSTDSMIITILSITTAAGFLLWILTLVILCCVCYYIRCDLCKDKGLTESVAPPCPPPTGLAPEPTPRVNPQTDESLYVTAAKTPNGRRQPNHPFPDGGLDPLYDLSPGHDFMKRMPDFEDDISEANTDGISNCEEVFIDDENRPEINMSSEVEERSAREVTSSTTPGITQPSTSHITNGLSPTSRLSHTHNNPLFVMQLKEAASQKAPERREDAGLYSDVEVDNNVM